MSGQPWGGEAERNHPKEVFVVRRRKFEFLTILGLIAVLLSSTAGYATAPVAKDIPDIRNRVNGAGAAAAAFLDLDDYVVDPDDRDATTSRQLPLTWVENTVGNDNVGIGAGNELQVTIPTSNAPEKGTTTFSVSDADPSTVFTNPVVVKTADFLVAGPLVDDQIFVGDSGATSPIPYAWAASEGQTLRINGVTQSGSGGRLFASISSGIGSTSFISASQIVAATDITQPVNSYEPGVQTRGVAAGTLSDVEINVANISVDADLNGMFVQALAGFSDWVRVSVTRRYGSGADDVYTVAVGELLPGSLTNLGGSPAGDATIIDASAVYGFDGITMTQFLGAASSAAYEANPAVFDDQATSWKVAGVGQQGVDLLGSTIGEISLTTSVPAATYPGATNDRALCIELNDADNCGILLTHKGLDPSSYAPGDIITLSVNVYVDLGYGGSATDADINRNSNGPALALALGTQPNLESVNYNFISFPFFSSQTIPGAAAAITPAVALHGKWTRHEVSFRVPESGISVSGPAGTGNIAYPASISAQILVARLDTSFVGHSQFVYLDNVSVTKVPGSLVLAEGATNVPMISAGWSFGYENGSTGILNVNQGDPVPASIARGQVIYGSFSDEAPSNNPTTVLANAANVAGSQYDDNAAAGWLAENNSSAVPGIRLDSDLSFIAQGSNDVALGFPTLASGNKALALAPSPAVVTGNYPTPNTSLAAAHPGGVKIVSPYLDLRLASSAVVPGLRVDDVTYPGGSIQGNVSGVFGVRFFHRTNATNVSQNPAMNVLLVNGDVNLGIVGTRFPNVLTAGNNTNYSGTVWLDDMISGSVVTFSSNQIMNQLTNGTLNTAMSSGNPGNQLAYVQIERAGAGFIGGAAISQDAAGLTAYQAVYGTGAAASANANSYPGRYSTAVVFVDEVGLHAVRDSNAFYDEDLLVFP